MRDVSAMLKEVYMAQRVAVVPGGGTYAMEAVARQFAAGPRALIVRNGWFSYRWSQIFERAASRRETTVVMARQTGNEARGALCAAADGRGRGQDPRDAARRGLRAACRDQRRDHPAGRLYRGQVAAAAHEVGALMVLDCIASGCIWVDMAATGVDVLISAPQKGWSASPSAGLVMLSAAGRGAAGGDHVEQLRARPEEVARDHGGL